MRMGYCLFFPIWDAIFSYGSEPSPAQVWDLVYILPLLGVLLWVFLAVTESFGSG